MKARKRLTRDERNLLATYRWLPDVHKKFVLHIAAYSVDMASVFDDRPKSVGVLTHAGPTRKAGAR
jgi:hypothetical protein